MNNHVVVVGNVTGDPDQRVSVAGNVWATFSIAENNRVKNAQTNQWEDGDPSYYDIKAFGHIGEKVSENMSKGTRVIVVGKITQDRWTNSEGENRSRVSIVASDVAESYMFAGDGGGSAVKRNAQTATAKAADEEEPF